MHDNQIPDTAELRELVKRDPSISGRHSWISRLVVGPHVAIHLTRVFLRLGWSGNQVTLLMMSCAFAGAMLFFLGSTAGYVGGAALMLLSYVLDASDGQVVRFRRQSSNLGIYLDRFTHRVSYPLQHIGMGYSLFNHTGTAGYMLFGGIVAYFYQLVVAHTLDKQLLQIERGGVDTNPIKTLRLHFTARMPLLDWPLKILVGSYSQLIQNLSFVILLIPMAFAGYVRDSISPMGRL